jgi:hypothetical protein
MSQALHINKSPRMKHKVSPSTSTNRKNKLYTEGEGDMDLEEQIAA